MSTRRKLGLSILAVYIVGMILIVAVFGATRQDNALFKPQDEFKLLSWVNLPGPLDINKGVLYLVIATTLTIGVMTWISKRMQGRPNRVQTAVEWAYTGMRDKIVRDNMDDEMAKKWFPLVFTLFVFIWISNLIGYLPLPVNSGETFDVFGANIPSFQIYAATANVSIPLVLALIVFFAYNIEGLRAKGLWGYTKSMIPPGVKGPILIMIFPLEILSHFLRLISLTVRLFANLLAGHMLIQFMSGGLAVLLGLEVLAWFTLPAGIAIFLFEVTLIAGLQAFIFAILTCIYLGSAVPNPTRRSLYFMGIVLDTANTVLAQAGAQDPAIYGQKAGRAIALGVGAGGGAAGAGAGIGMLFGKVIESVTRQPEMRDEIASIQWLGFALTEACFFYGLVGGLIAFFL